MPPVADHVTAVLLEPVTVAVNCCVLLVVSDADAGDIETTTAGVTVSAADAVRVLSATLAARTT